jgi:hypothetical protein
MVFFHDLAFPDVARGFLYFKELEGWKTQIYHTQQVVGVAWRGNVQPPQHTPDPEYAFFFLKNLFGDRFTWKVPAHLEQLYDQQGLPK